MKLERTSCWYLVLKFKEGHFLSPSNQHESKQKHYMKFVFLYFKVYFAFGWNLTGRIEYSLAKASKQKYQLQVRSRLPWTEFSWAWHSVTSPPINYMFHLTIHVYFPCSDSCLQDLKPSLAASYSLHPWGFKLQPTKTLLSPSPAINHR